MRYPYTDDQKSFLVQYGADLNTVELTQKLNNEFRVQHTPGSVRTMVKRLSVKKSKMCRSQNCAMRGEPIGSARIIGGYRYIKMRTSSGGFYKDWDREINIVYRETYGDIPDGYMVVTLDGDKLNASPKNLCAISKSVAVRMANGRGKKMWSEFPEVTRTAIEICKLDDSIKEVITNGTTRLPENPI